MPTDPEYSKLNKLVKKSSKIDDNNWAIRVATDFEEARVATDL